MATTDELLDILMKDYKKPEDLIGENGRLKQLTKRLLERAMQTELTEHLGYEKHAPQGKNSGNSRNGGYKKTITGDFGNLDITTPRDRNSTFEPVILPKGKTRFTGFDDKIISMYARGMTTLDIQGHLQEIYGIDVLTFPGALNKIVDRRFNPEAIETGDKLMVEFNILT
jgi:putative transposase